MHIDLGARNTPARMLTHAETLNVVVCTCAIFGVSQYIGTMTGTAIGRYLMQRIEDCHDETIAGRDAAWKRFSAECRAKEEM